VNPKVIIGQRIGRLGNQVYLLAHLIALHQATGIGFSHPTLGHYSRFFKGSQHDPLVRYPVGRACWPSSDFLRQAVYSTTRLLDKSGLLNRIDSDRCLRIDYQEIFDLSDPGFIDWVRRVGTVWLLGGWLFRYPTATAVFLPALREFFALAQPFADNVSRLVERARRGGDILVGVHLRQTDFKEHAGGRYYFTTSEYAAVMYATADLFPSAKIRFLIVSDEPKTAADFPGLDCAFGSGVPVEDMYCLGGCDYLISSFGSSFSAWPRFLFQVAGYQIEDPFIRPQRGDFRTTFEPWQLIA
jgi:hypothetical protein